MNASWIITATIAIQMQLPFAESLAETTKNDSCEPRLSVLDDSSQPHCVTTLQNWLRHRKLILKHVQSVMGNLPRPKHRVPLCPEVVFEVKEGRFVRKKIAYHTDSQFDRVYAWLLIPNSSSGTRLPAVLCLHQTTPFGKDEPTGLAGDPNLAYARELAERGFVTLSPDYPSFGEYKHDFNNDNYLSGSMKAIYDNLRAVDYLATCSQVDANRIGVIGHSLGGHNAIFTAVFDPRLKVIVSSCGFTRFHKYYKGNLGGWTSPRYMPRIQERYHSNPDEMPFDFTDLISYLAPRPFMAVAPLRDHNFDVEGVRDVMSAALPIYRLYSAANRMRALYPDCQHEFLIRARLRAYEFIEHHL